MTAEELHAEQAHIDRAYARIDELRSAAAERATVAMATSVKGGQIADKIDRDALVRTSLLRRDSLQIGDQSLCFGRLDTAEGDVFHIGRLSVSDATGDSLMVDWRAPIAESFYRATVHEPGGMRRRRHIRMHRRIVVSIDDELLDRDAVGDDRLALVGEAALLAALSARRTGRMGDIVATIQSEQDRAIRSPLAGVLVVQGGPGTGKTAVALHRAAYLLYAHRFPLGTQGVLVVGPNPVFCRYVENVLPGLGETGVRLATPGQLVPGVSVTTVDAPADAAVKGDESMVERLRATIAAHQPPLDETAAVGLGAWRLRITPEQSEALIATAQQASTYNAGRVALRRALIKELAQQARRARARATRVGHAGPSLLGADWRGTVDVLRRSAAVKALVNRLAPPLSAAQIVDETIAAAGLETRAARSEHDAALLDEAAALIGPEPRPRGARRRPTRLTLDDALDKTLSEMGELPECPECEVELRMENGLWVCDACFRRWRPQQVMSEEGRRRFEELVDSVTNTHRAEVVDTERVDTFGHAVVDEAQDLTPMQWRVIRRRVPGGSLTVVGDLAQAKHPWAATSWDAVGAAAADAAVEVLELGVNYRTPEEIMRLAAAVLAASRPGVVPPRSVRRAGVEPTVIRIDDARGLLDTARATANDELAANGGGKAAIIVPAEMAVPAGADVLDADVAELGVEDAKGLEFDVVVLVEPAAFDPGALYVALTRSTSRLAIVHAAPLPDCFP